jgi:hypothetical protein
VRYSSAALFLAVSVALGTWFGRNKVQSGESDWWEISTDHFAIYYTQGSETAAETLAVIADQELRDLASQFDYYPDKPIPMILYTSPGAFRQTEITTGDIGEAVGGFTEFFKGRVVIPFTGYWAEFRHVVLHELSHAYVFDMLYRRSIYDIVSSNAPLWTMEGLAEYTSIGWDEASENEFRDMVIAQQITSVQDLSRRNDYLVYRQGQAIYHFMAERYGEDTVRRFVTNLRTSRGIENVIERTLDMNIAQFNEKFQDWAHETYWSELADREGPEDVGNPIFEDDDRVFMLGTVISSDGSLIAGLEPYHAHYSIAVRSSFDGHVVARPVVAGGLSEIGLSPAYRICDFSPGAESLVVAFHGVTTDGLFICTDDGRSELPVRMQLIRDPVWSPDGRYIAFAGMEDGSLDLYLWDIRDRRLEQLTDTPDGVRDLNWSETGLLGVVENDGGTSYSITSFGIDGSREVLRREPSEIRYPLGTAGGIIYRSNIDSTPDLYLLEGDGTVNRLTHLYRTVEYPAWAESSDVLIFEAMDWGGAGIFLSYDMLERRAAGSGTLPGTGSARGPRGRQAGVPGRDNVVPEETALADVIGPDLRIAPYTPELTIDLVSAVAGYDSYQGLAGYTQFVFSDILAHHRIFVLADVNGDISDADAGLYYYYLPKRTDLAAFVFRNSNRYRFIFQDGHTEVVRDVEIGAGAGIQYPVTPSLRFDCELDYRNLSRRGIWQSTLELDEDIFSVAGHVVYDNALWGSVGPRVGNRMSIGFEVAPRIGSSASYTTITADLRQYLWVSPEVTLALRLAGGTSFGENAQQFFLGGTVPHRRSYGEVEGPENILGFYTSYADMLRGYEFADLKGRRYGLATLELRIPVVQTLTLRAPIPMTIQNGRGALFVDTGTAFDDLSSWRGSTTSSGFRLEDLKMGLGVGFRVNLGLFLLMTDTAWRTDLRGISQRPIHYFTLGAEF